MRKPICKEMTTPKKYPVNEEEKEVSRVEDLDLSATYSYFDYLKWTFEDRLELIKGKIFKMSAPARVHQEVTREIIGALYNYLKGQACKAYTAPFDVRLPFKGEKEDKEIFTVVQPDICVVCDPEKLDERGCIGAPDIVVEILSPGNNRKELRNKYEVYQESGVKEYWIVWPGENSFMRYVLDNNGCYQPSKVMTMGEEITTPLLPGFVLRLDEVFNY